MQALTWSTFAILALFAGNLRGAAITFSVDIASPALSGGIHPSDILVPGPNLFLSGSSLGLGASDSFGDFSFGNDPIMNPQYFSVGREAVGTPGSDVFTTS